MKKIRITVIFLYFVFFVGLIFLYLWSKFKGYGIPAESIFYWWLLIGWLYLIYSSELTSRFSMGTGLFLYILGSVLTVISLETLGEFVFRISYIGWLIGVLQAIYETRIRLKDS